MAVQTITAEDEMVLDELQALVVDQQKVVTAKGLAWTISQPVHKVKRLMELFWEQHKVEVTAVWQLSGWVSQPLASTNQAADVAVSASCGEGAEADKKVATVSGIPCVGAPGATSAFLVRLAKTEDLEDEKAAFPSPPSIHIFSIQKVLPPHPSLLCAGDVDLLLERFGQSSKERRALSDNSLSSVQCEGVTYQSRGRVPVLQHTTAGTSAGIAAPASAPVAGGAASIPGAPLPSVAATAKAADKPAAAADKTGWAAAAAAGGAAGAGAAGTGASGAAAAVKTGRQTPTSVGVIQSKDQIGSATSAARNKEAGSITPPGEINEAVIADGTRKDSSGGGKESGSLGGRRTEAGDAAPRKDPDPIQKLPTVGPQVGKAGSQAVAGKASSGRGTLFGMWNKGGEGSKGMGNNEGEMKQRKWTERGAVKDGKDSAAVQREGTKAGEGKRALTGSGLQGSQAVDSPGSDLEDDLEEEMEEEALTFGRTATGGRSTKGSGLLIAKGGDEERAGGESRKKRRVAVHDDDEDDEAEDQKNKEENGNHTSTDKSMSSGDRSEDGQGTDSRGDGERGKSNRELQHQESPTATEETKGQEDEITGRTAAVPHPPPAPAAKKNKSLADEGVEKEKKDVERHASVGVSAAELCGEDASTDQQHVAPGDKRDFTSPRKEVKKAGKQSSAGRGKNAKSGKEEGAGSPERNGNSPAQGGDCGEASEKVKGEKGGEKGAGKRHTGGKEKQQGKKRAVKELQEKGEDRVEGGKAPADGVAAATGNREGPDKTGGGSGGRKKQKLVWQTDVDEKGREVTKQVWVDDDEGQCGENGSTIEHERSEKGDMDQENPRIPSKKPPVEGMARAAPKQSKPTHPVPKKGQGTISAFFKRA